MTKIEYGAWERVMPTEEGVYQFKGDNSVDLISDHSKNHTLYYGDIGEARLKNDIGDDISLGYLNELLDHPYWRSVTEVDDEGWSREIPKEEGFYQVMSESHTKHGMQVVKNTVIYTMSGGYLDIRVDNKHYALSEYAGDLINPRWRKVFGAKVDDDGWSKKIPTEVGEYEVRNPSDSLRCPSNANIYKEDDGLLMLNADGIRYQVYHAEYLFDYLEWRKVDGDTDDGWSSAVPSEVGNYKVRDMTTCPHDIRYAYIYDNPCGRMVVSCNSSLVLIDDTERFEKCYPNHEWKKVETESVCQEEVVINSEDTVVDWRESEEEVYSDSHMDKLCQKILLLGILGKGAKEMTMSEVKESLLPFFSEDVINKAVKHLTAILNK